MLLGDGMLTPAISVMSAVEGLSVVSPKLTPPGAAADACHFIHFIFAPKTCRTGKIGQFFGPIILVWFLVIGILGLSPNRTPTQDFIGD